MEEMGRGFILQTRSLVLGTLASTQPRRSSRVYNRCSTSAGEKTHHVLGTKFSTRTSCSFFRHPDTRWDPFDCINLRPISFQETGIGFSFKKFFYIYIELSIWKNTSGIGPQPRNCTRFQQHIISTKKRAGELYL